VDPGETDDSCLLGGLFEPKLIVVSSPEEKHGGESEFTVRKDRGEIRSLFKYYPVWDLEEILSARTRFRPTLTEEGVKEKFRKVGGVPWNIFVDGSKTVDNNCMTSSTILVAHLMPFQQPSVQESMKKLREELGTSLLEFYYMVPQEQFKELEPNPVCPFFLEGFVAHTNSYVWLMAIPNPNGITNRAYGDQSWPSWIWR
jgi:hypothetical protein